MRWLRDGSGKARRGVVSARARVSGASVWAQPARAMAMGEEGGEVRRGTCVSYVAVVAEVRGRRAGAGERRPVREAVGGAGCGPGSERGAVAAGGGPGAERGRGCCGRRAGAAPRRGGRWWRAVCAGRDRVRRGDCEGESRGVGPGARGRGRCGRRAGVGARARLRRGRRAGGAAPGQGAVAEAASRGRSAGAVAAGGGAVGGAPARSPRAACRGRSAGAVARAASRSRTACAGAAAAGRGAGPPDEGGVVRGSARIVREGAMARRRSRGTRESSCSGGDGQVDARAPEWRVAARERREGRVGRPGVLTKSTVACRSGAAPLEGSRASSSLASSGSKSTLESRTGA